MDILSHVKYDPDMLKEPRAFIRFIQVFLAIFAFASIASVRTESTISIACSKNATVRHDVAIKYGYPFRMKGNTKVMLPFCSTPKEQEPKMNVFSGNFSASAEFFCFVGVISFIALLLILPAYVFLSSYFNKGTLMTKLDFVSSAAWLAIWFVASVAWANSVSRILKYTDPAYLIQELGDEYCPTDRCFPGRKGDPSNLVVSALFGFLNMGVQGACLWFIFKDTDWHKDKDGTNNGDAQADFDQPYAEPGYQTPEYQNDPTVPTTPPNGNTYGSSAPVPQARNDYYNGGGSSLGQPTY